ncbi:hypothetical protein N7466_007229 [Penicillium verhagenii]|uniref:uncharacterized protein n=1 Tax=Penicillium verhagenii TaxID=1562060 RepID=UPI002545A9AE|nr:uncharacterized protein N7466_007229 [Penicillium verhagenii]KAJ5928273.1 hypothetical protein N7466_007229 [Penicillium verhagenii]
MNLFSNRDESAGLLEAEDYAAKSPEIEKQSRSPANRRSIHCICIWVLLFTNLVTLGVVFQQNRLAPNNLIEQPSHFAGLQRTREEPFVMQTKYASENETLRNELWYNINIDDGMVALSDEWAAQHGLRTAQRFPWDNSKGIYLLHGFHNLHCLKIIYIALNEYRSEESQSRNWHHIVHCMDALRRQILCDADDTPRATERRAEVVTGVNQHRMCRQWDGLVDFARQNTACYKRPEMPDVNPVLDRYRHCPPGSGYVTTGDYVPTDEIVVGLPEESIED